MKYARANPGAVTVGTTGVGSDDHLAMLLFEKAAGVKMTHVGYKAPAKSAARWRVNRSRLAPLTSERRWLIRRVARR